MLDKQRDDHILEKLLFMLLMDWIGLRLAQHLCCIQVDVEV